MKRIVLDNPTAEVLSRATVDGDVIRLPSEQLERNLYVRVDKALKAIGAKWNRKLGGHVLGERDSLERFEAMLEGGVATVESYGFFPTPPSLVDRLLELAEIEPHHRVLEPSAGQGAISTRLLEIVGKENLHVVELQQKHADVLASQDYKNLRIGDFMATEFPRSFNRIVMNPPFERQQDIDHVTRAFGLLAPEGGRLVSIMGAGATQGTRAKNKAFKELVDTHGRIEANPDGSFEQAGTNVRTITVVLDVPDGDGAVAL